MSKIEVQYDCFKTHIYRTWHTVPLRSKSQKSKRLQKLFKTQNLKFGQFPVLLEIQVDLVICEG